MNGFLLLVIVLSVLLWFFLTNDFWNGGKKT